MILEEGKTHNVTKAGIDRSWEKLEIDARCYYLERKLHFSEHANLDICSVQLKNGYPARTRFLLVQGLGKG